MKDFEKEWCDGFLDGVAPAESRPASSLSLTTQAAIDESIRQSLERLGDLFDQVGELGILKELKSI